MAKSSGNDSQNQLINLQAQQLAAQVAHWAALLEFQKERLRLLELPEMQGKLQIEIDRLAWEKAQGEWERSFKEASLTGTYNGRPTLEWLTQQAQLTGVLNGQQTLQGKLTDAQLRQMDQSMRLANDQFLAQTTGYYNGQKTFDREKFEQAQAQDAWKFLATLTGPANAFKQARAIGSMSGGMRDIMGAWAGRYATPGSTAVGSGGQASLAGLMEGVSGEPNPVTGQYGAAWTATPLVDPQQTTGAFNHNNSNPNLYGPVPGRGFDPRTWNASTQQAVAAWNQTHPGFEADGSALGYRRLTVMNTPAPVQAADPNPQPAPVYTPGPYVPPPGAGIRPEPRPVPMLPIQPAPGTGQDPPVSAPPPGEPPREPINQFPVSDGTGTVYAGGTPGWTTQAYSYAPAGIQAAPENWNYSPTLSGTMQVYPPGVYSPAGTPDISTTTPVSPATAYSMYQYGAPQSSRPAYTPRAPIPAYAPPPVSTEPAPTPNPYDPIRAGVSYTGPLLPNQINAKNYANSFQYQRELGWANFEDQGWDKGLAQEAFQRSLPKYNAPKSGSYAF